ncbi:bifunctional riboflavin kinase/FAD synthetase [Alteribacillus sp. HJP-4]|uniref:bifunctional riboflavin kinase/FAD synthetase n=1 Tax=Alteribacillus sp. HJP-4 TaxID=2775394 RepID=UPI0035CCE341
MKTIFLYHQQQLFEPAFPEMVLALGYFDGVHLGHQSVIETAKQTAAEKGTAVGVMTFHPHPKTVLSSKFSEETMRYITPSSRKEELMYGLGVDYLFVVHFDKAFAALEPQQFIDDYVIRFRAVHVVAGFDFSYGRLGKGTMETMPFHARQSFSQTTISQVAAPDGEKISSTLIRNYISNGDLFQVRGLLGRPYDLDGVVVTGEQRGRTIGFPTANVSVRDPYLLPATGVYAVRMLVDNQWKDGVCNIGYKPTFHDEQEGPPQIEVHVLDFEGDLYEKEVRVQFLKKIRGEKKFNSADELVIQIKADKEKAEKILSVKNSV